IAFVILLTASTWAQAQDPSLTITFPFAVGGKVLDAGNYSVGTASNGNVVLTPETGGAAVEVAPIKAISQRKVDRPELVFELVGSVYFLSEVWLPGKGGTLVGKVDYSQERKSVKGPKVK
ncbi:MAG: hypothetical protein Q7V01_06765, partial [Vicinamibacterales bacterium]|nr:hypothetical protein [Vicinamibacterales bacterium]